MRAAVKISVCFNWVRFYSLCDCWASCVKSNICVRASCSKAATILLLPSTERTSSPLGRRTWPLHKDMFCNLSYWVTCFLAGASSVSDYKWRGDYDIEGHGRAKQTTRHHGDNGYSLAALVGGLTFVLSMNVLCKLAWYIHVGLW